MGEEVKIADYPGGGADDERVSEWELGLPSPADLPPLSQALIPPELASAFSISPEPYRTLLDVNRASQDTISAIRGGASQAFSSSNFQLDDRATVFEPDATAFADEELEPDRDGSGSDSRKLRKIDSAAEEADSAAPPANDDPSARSMKRPRLVWTPQLHKRFVDVVAHLGIKNAVPKTIMQLMNVEGLTRENVASHLQKYRLYLKRMQGLSNEGPSSSDQLFASTPVPQSLHESGGAGGSAGHSHGNGHLPVPIPLPYPAPPAMMPMPMLGMPPMSMAVGNHHGFNPLAQQRDWSGANKFGSVVSYPQSHSQGVTPSDK
ncbi:hypothetical protein HN51_042818 [Arachis hypogaea]|uniref:transcription factor PCL1-like n=1 Tax=Arachis ipaensis TaxID=130454 RepID=UPI0007AF9207|nr:transcription factor PCL1-like [Arachis ipaensis]XP_025670993.1 transcription factor PCL1 [Arachis hypogaea]QHN94971.1 Transcription factor LUX [Arachis hypogaea]